MRPASLRRCNPVGPRCLLLIALLSFATVSACGRDSDREGRSATSEAPPPAPAAGPPLMEKAESGVGALRIELPADQIGAMSGSRIPTSADSAVPRMILRNGEARMEVRDLDVAVERVRALAKRVGGYVAGTSLQVDPGSMRSAFLEMKIPASNFDSAVGGLEAIGEVESVRVTADDVTEEYVDVGARMANARRLETRLIELLAQRTGSLQDVLAVERELARVREEIERYEGRLRYLRTSAAMSTLRVTVHEPTPIVGTPRGGGLLRDALRSAWRNFLGLVVAIIASLGVVVPLAILAALAWLAVRAILRRRGRRREP